MWDFTKKNVQNKICSIGFYINKSFRNKGIVNNEVRKVIKFIKNTRIFKVMIISSHKEEAKQIALKNGFAKYVHENKFGEEFFYRNISM